MRDSTSNAKRRTQGYLVGSVISKERMSGDDMMTCAPKAVRASMTELESLAAWSEPKMA